MRYIQFIINERILTHISFWFFYYLYRIYWYGLVTEVNSFENVAIVQALEMPVKAMVVYLNLYILMPLLIKKKHTFLYVIAILLCFLISGIIQREVINFCIFLGIYDKPYNLYSYQKFIAILSHIIGIYWLTTIIKISKDAYLNLQVNKQLMEEKLEAELKFLKSQINPHFFFNTLNNLYSLILMKSEKAETVVLKLSDLMSYMLYETNQSEVAIEKEIKYLQDYVALEKLRFGEELNLTFEVLGEIKHQKIAPVMLITLVENAFKHAKNDISHKISIGITMRIDGQKFQIEVKNSILEVEEKRNAIGIGLANLQRRLELLYKNNYTLQTEQKEGMFVAYLKLILN